MAIDYERDLNPAQAEAVRHAGGPLLVIAGAGSGKTRTIVYRLAHLVSLGADPDSILLLTFTRKASQEMLRRAGLILGQGLPAGSGGTFHSFAYRTLKRHSARLDRPGGFTIMDRADAADLLAEAKERLKLGKGDKSFPKRATILELVSKARNKEVSLATVLQAESFHLLPYAQDLERMSEYYARLKADHGLYDYDDLLFELEKLLARDEVAREEIRRRYVHLMVDEYQDTNLVQARLVKLMAGERGNVMAVGDDAQSIYAFRGANVTNILRFPQDFPGAAIVRLEQNYRSTQPILDLTNAILAGAAVKFDKHLFTTRENGVKPELVLCHSDASQARLVVDKVRELSRKYLLHEIAVLFRAGYQAFQLEVLLNKAGIRYQKYGGIKFTEAAHIKDVLCYLRLVANATDLPAWQRSLTHIPGVGPKTASGVAQAVITGEAAKLAKYRERFPALAELLVILDALRRRAEPPARTLAALLDYYQPILVSAYPDDWPRRQQGLEELSALAGQYRDLELFLADVSLETPEDEAAGQEDILVLSTVHSAKGLEWPCVLLIDLVEERFPVRRSLTNAEDMEEERRLLYVAATRAKDRLLLYVPEALFIRHQQRHEPARPSPFVLEWAPELVSRWRETYSGGVVPAEPARTEPAPTLALSSPATRPEAGTAAPAEAPAPKKLGRCTHKIFGEGKIVAFIPPDKYRVNFQNFGLKVIVGQYLSME